MPEFSNLLRQRLAAGERVRVHADAHPDADTLTAYAEQLLTGRERNRIVEHLSACNECREVVALSLPQAEEAAVVAAAAPSAGRRRFTWKWTPAFGWAASVATLAIVTLLVIEAPHKRTPSFTSNQPPSVAPAPSAPTASAAPAVSAESNAPAAAQPEIARASENAKTASPGVTRNDSSAGAPAMLARAAHQPSREADISGRPMAAAPQPSAPVSASAASVIAATADRQDYRNQMFEAEARSAESPALVSELPTAPAPQPGNQPGLFVVNNSPTMQFSGLNQNPPSPTPLRITTPNVGGRSGPHIVARVGSELKDLILPKRYIPPISAPRRGFLPDAMGGTQLNPAKEKDQSVEIASEASGKSTGNLDQLPAFTTRAMGATASAPEKKELAPGWKVTDGRLLKSSDSASWAEGYSGAEGIAFSVVNARGQEVWAGGANAALVHSRDGGATWERITLGASATGTITSIETGHSMVRVKSSSGQSWSSADGGKSWNLQD